MMKKNLYILLLYSFLNYGSEGQVLPQSADKSLKFVKPLIGYYGTSWLVVAEKNFEENSQENSSDTLSNSLVGAEKNSSDRFSEFRNKRNSPREKDSKNK